MRNLNRLENSKGMKIKRKSLHGMWGDDANGCFRIRLYHDTYYVMVSNGEGWEHVSVSHKDSIPSWDVMNKIKSVFFHDDEVVMQLHPKKEDYVNVHPNCLHLWRPIHQKIPLPPKWMIG